MIGPFYAGQIPADPLVLTVYKEDGTARDLSGYESVTLLLRDGSGTDVDTSGGDASIDLLATGRVVYVWPTAGTLFAAAGTYRYQLQLNGPGAIVDYTGVSTFDVLALGTIEMIPPVGQFALFWGDEAPTTDADWEASASSALLQAADLLFMTTGLEDLPVDVRQARLVQYAIMDMAILLSVSDPSEAYSPYSGERIGSYSYTLRQNAAKGATGAFWWDMVIAALRDGDWDDAFSYVVDGEQVFHRGFGLFYRSERLLHASPIVSPPGSFDAGVVDPSRGADRWLPFGSTSDGSWAGDPYDWPW